MRAALLLLSVLVLAAPATAQEEGAAEGVRALSAQIEELSAGEDGLAGEELDLARDRIRRARESLREALTQLVEEAQAEGAAGELRALAIETLQAADRRTRGMHAAALVELEAQRARRGEAEDSAAVDEAIEILQQRVDANLAGASEMLGLYEQLAEDDSGLRPWLGTTVTERAERSMARIRSYRERIDSIEGRVQGASEDQKTALELELSSEELRLATAVGVLESMVSVLDELELESAQYKTLLVTATGQITGDIFDSDVALGLFEDWISGIKEKAVEKGPTWIFKAFLFVAILVLFRMLGILAKRMVKRTLSSSHLHFSKLLRDFFEGLAGKVVFLIGLLIALSQLDVQLGPVLAGFGIAGFVLGFALQETLGNFAAGLMILTYRPFDVGDIVSVAGVEGTVGNMSLVSTTISTFDNQLKIVPNSKIWGDVITNVTARKTRRVDLVFGIGYEDEIPEAERILTEILRAHEQVLEEPAPIVKVFELGDSSVNFICRPWVKTADYWDVYWDVTREVKLRFDAEGISIPYPQRDVHIHQANSAPAEESDLESEAD